MRVDFRSRPLAARVILCMVSILVILPSFIAPGASGGPAIAGAADRDRGHAELLPAEGWSVAPARDALDRGSYVTYEGRYCRVRTTAGKVAARDIAAWADRYLKAFRRVFSGDFKIRGKLTLVVYAHREEFMRRYHSVYGGNAKPRKGLYAPHLMETWITLDAVTPAAATRRAPGARRALPLETTQHEFTHHLLHFFTGQASLPPWFNEGAACFFQYWNIDQSRQENVAYNLARARRGYYGYFPRVVRQCYGTTDFVPPLELLQLDYQQFHVQDRRQEMIHYSESWALVNFLAGTPDGKRFFDRIVETLSRGDDIRKLFTPAALESLEKAWYRDIAERIIPARGHGSAQHVSPPSTSIRAAQVRTAR